MDSVAQSSFAGYPTPKSLTPKMGGRLIGGSRIVDSIPIASFRTILDVTEPCVVNFMGLNFNGGTVSQNLGTVDRLKITGNGVVLCDGSYSLFSGGLDIIGSTAAYYYATQYGGSALTLPVKFETLKVEIDTTSTLSSIALYGALVMV